MPACAPSGEAGAADPFAFLDELPEKGSGARIVARSRGDAQPEGTAEDFFRGLKRIF